MMKKLLASLLAVLMAFGMLMVVVCAEDVTEPAEPEEPAYTPVEYQIADLVAAVEAGEDVYLQPTDVILLKKADPAEPVEPAEPEVTPAAAVDEPTDPEDESASVLVVEYLPGKGGVVSEKGLTRFVDYDASGYAICALGDYTDYSYKDTERQTNNAIDFANENGYAFKQWKIQTIYSGPEFSRIVLEAEWDEPALSGWEGFKTMMRGYIKTIIDYIIEYLKEWLAQLGDFIGGSPA